MPAEPVPADPGPDDDLGWLDRDPMTAKEREEWLDQVCEQDAATQFPDGTVSWTTPAGRTYATEPTRYPI